MAASRRRPSGRAGRAARVVECLNRRRVLRFSAFSSRIDSARHDDAAILGENSGLGTLLAREPRGLGLRRGHGGSGQIHVKGRL